MKIILNFIITSLLILALGSFLPGVQVNDIWTALSVALVLAFLNTFIKPILVILTLPITVVTLGLFLLVLNACIILIADSFLSGFQVQSFWTALLFSLLLSFCKSIIDTLILKSES